MRHCDKINLEVAHRVVKSTILCLTIGNLHDVPWLPRFNFIFSSQKHVIYWRKKHQSKAFSWRKVNIEHTYIMLLHRLSSEYITSWCHKCHLISPVVTLMYVRWRLKTVTQPQDDMLSADTRMHDQISTHIWHLCVFGNIHRMKTYRFRLSINIGHEWIYSHKMAKYKTYMPGKTINICTRLKHKNNTYTVS